MADLKSLQKSINAKYISFFDYLNRTPPKLGYLPIFELTFHIDLLSKFLQCSNQNIKKRTILYIYTFLQGFQICPQNSKILILKF